MASTDVADEGLKAFAEHGSLAFLTLSKTSVSDAGITALAGKNLKSVNIDETAVTDAALKHLAGLESVTSINVRKTGVTAEGVEEAKKIRGDGNRLNIYK